MLGSEINRNHTSFFFLENGAGKVIKAKIDLQKNYRLACFQHTGLAACNKV